jgi:hypothetical protein
VKTTIEHLEETGVTGQNSKKNRQHDGGVKTGHDFCQKTLKARWDIFKCHVLN